MKPGTVMHEKLKINRVELPIEKILILYLEKLETLTDLERQAIPTTFNILSHPFYYANSRALEELKKAL